MMNCFEARQDFVGFWQQRARGRTPPRVACASQGMLEVRPRISRLCADGADAPFRGRSRRPSPQSARRSHDAPQSMRQDVPHLDFPINMNGLRSADAQRAAEIVRRASVYRLADRRPSRRWREAAAGLSAVAAAVLLALLLGGRAVPVLRRRPGQFGFDFRDDCTAGHGFPRAADTHDSRGEQRPCRIVERAGSSW